MKSNSKASTTSKITTQRAACTGSMIGLQRESGILEDDALDQVRHVFAAVRDGFQQLIDSL